MSTYIAEYQTNMLPKDWEGENGLSWEDQAGGKTIRFSFGGDYQYIYLADNKTGRQIDAPKMEYVSNTAYSDTLYKMEYQYEHPHLLILKRMVAEGRLVEAGKLIKALEEEMEGDETYEKYRVLLSPPKFEKKTTFSIEDMRKNQDWVRNHGRHYKGKWVGVYKGLLQFAAEKLQDVKEEYKAIEGIYITYL